MSIVELRISALSRESIERSQPHLNPDRVSYYREHADEITPLVVFDVDGVLLLADGHHRIAAAQQLGWTTVKAEIRKGQQSDALRFAVEHGKQQRGLSEQQIMDAIARRGQQPG
ncbi:ParB/RepB/Spo0J family partition protein [bacterium RCC_150]